MPKYYNKYFSHLKILKNHDKIIHKKSIVIESKLLQLVGRIYIFLGLGSTVPKYKIYNFNNYLMIILNYSNFGLKPDHSGVSRRFLIQI